MAESKYYAWSTLYIGGESEVRQNASSIGRKIVVSRNIVNVGDPVTKADLKKMGATDEDWEAFLAGGSVRDYPYPKMPEGSQQSPNDFVLEKLRTGDREDLDSNTLMALAMGGSGPLVPAHLDTTGEDVKEVSTK